MQKITKTFLILSLVASSALLAEDETYSNDGAKIFGLSSLESLMLGNTNVDLTNRAIASLGLSQAGEITPFALIGGGYTKYKVGSGAKLKSKDFNFVVGTGYNFDNSIAGWFFQYGRGNYKGKDSGVHEDGDWYKNSSKQNNYNYGIGLFDKTFIGDAYVDGALHLGKAKVNLKDSYKDEEGKDQIKDAYNASYYGTNIGLGYILGNGERNSFDTSLRYLYNQVNAKNRWLNDEEIKIKRINSNRLQLAEQYKFIANDYLTLRAGAMFEYEFTAKSKLSGTDEDGDAFTVPDMKVKGASYTGELGVELTPFGSNKNTSIDLNAKGYGGKKQGASGNIALKYSF